VSGFFGSPAMRLLFRLKFRGGLRKQVRRLKEPKHWIFLVVGGLAALSWIGMLFVNALTSQRISSVGPDVFVVTQISMFVLFALTIVGAFSYRGLYLPKDEIEMGFSAPLTRSDLVRYRMFVSMMKSLFAGFLFGVAAAMRTGGSLYAFFGVFVGMLTVPLVGQGAALVLGGAENKIGKLAKYFPGRLVVRVGIVLFVLLAILYANDMIRVPNGVFDGAENEESFTLDRFAAHPLVHVLLWPFTPWARMITANSFLAFAPYFAFAVGTWLLLFESVARIRVDYRELSLATSADIAKRISRMRKGNLGTKGSVTRATIGWNVPWFFGRGAFGAVAWNKTAAIVRKSRGTLIISALIIAFLTILGTAVTHGTQSEEKLLLGGSFLLAGVGTLYMCAGLRFDFRMDFELMDRVKTWPLRPSMLFLATILPEVLLVSAMLFIAVLARALWIGTYHPGLVGVLAFQPLATLTWVALDNAVFLFSPIRYTPGEEGALQNMGRSMLLMILRGVLMGVVVFVVLLPAMGVKWVVNELSDDSMTSWWAAGAFAWVALLALDAVLIWLGGKMLRRFDVAKDRPV